MAAETSPPATRVWHACTVAEILSALDVDPMAGLSTAEAEGRLQATGPNALRERARRSPFAIFLRQFSDFMILVLIAAAGLSAGVGEAEDTLAIAVIIVLNALIGFAQEWRAEHALQALRRLAAPRALLRRDGAHCDVAAATLVPGDIVLLEAGNRVPADLRLLESVQLALDESMLTGESVPVAKDAMARADADCPVAERRTLAYMATTVTRGRGVGVVVATGMVTEIGRIAAAIAQEPERRTPLQQRLADFGHRISVVVLVVCLALFVAGVANGEPVGIMALTAISLAVAAIPEALPAVVTILLALGARRMARIHALVRRLPAVETLGSVTHICADKTGTLTENRMIMDMAWAAGARARDLRGLAAQAPWTALFEACALNNDAQLAPQRTGDPTEIALLEAAAVAGVTRHDANRRLPRVSELPFTAERKRMTTLHRDPRGQILAIAKGAPEVILPRCRLAPDDLQQAVQEAAAFAALGLRVLAFAQRPLAALPDTPDEALIERDLELTGLVGLLDPPRLEVAAAIADCRAAGIVPVMITGDHPATALAIATRLDIAGADAAVVTGRELASLDPAGIGALVADCRVFARVDPAQKIALVEALQARGHFVAMTGDGVNDAPALLRADIGVAMGKGGTDVAREAASLVLLDDNFTTIVHAVREGRRIHDNIRKFVRYALTGNTAEILTICVAPLCGLPIPLLPIHILWVNLVTDGLPGLALAAEPAEPGTMTRPPRPPRESLFAHGVWQHVLWVGVLIAGLCLGVQNWALQGGSPHGQTMVFTVLTLSQMGHVLAIRGERVSLFRQGLRSNLPLLGAVALTLGLQFALLYVPALNTLFSTVPLALHELAVCLGISLLPFLAVEAEKRWLRWV